MNVYVSFPFHPYKAHNPPPLASPRQDPSISVKIGFPPRAMRPSHKQLDADPSFSISTTSLHSLW
jgi:hypothetical protein